MQLTVDLQPIDYYQEVVPVSKTQLPIEWISTKEAAAIMDIDRDTVANYCRLGKLECRKFGRDWQVNKTAAVAFVKSNSGRPKKDDL